MKKLGYGALACFVLAAAIHFMPNALASPQWRVLAELVGYTPAGPVGMSNAMANNLTRPPIIWNEAPDKIDISASACTSDLVITGGYTRYLVSCDVPFYFTFGDGADETVTNADTRLPAGAYEFVVDRGGFSNRFCALDINGAAGDCWVMRTR